MAENMTDTPRMLVLSSEAAVLGPLQAIAEPNCWQIETAVNAWDAIERVQSGGTPNLLVLDFSPGNDDGLHILRWMRRLRPNLPVIVIFAQANSGGTRDAIRLGAQEILVRPFDESRLQATIQRHLTASAGEEAETVSEDVEQLGPDSFFVSASPVTQKLRAQAELLAEADVPVLILGEPGSGKETVARLIHKLSVRSSFPFLKVNCADMPGYLLETELFGTPHAAGKLELAENGTVLLDEITEMPLALQSRLMQALKHKAVSRPDSDETAPLEARILAATCTSVDHALAERKLREDLYYYLTAFTVQVPALRQRRSEIGVLLRHSMHRLATHYGLPFRDFSGALLDACQQYCWPGNLRELESVVKRYLLTGDEVLRGELPADNTAIPLLLEARAAETPHSRSLASEADRSAPKSLKSLIHRLRWDAEKDAIEAALHQTGWNRKAAAGLLKVSYRTMLYKIDQYHLLPPRPSEPALPGLSAQRSKERC